MATVTFRSSAIYVPGESPPRRCSPAPARRGSSRSGPTTSPRACWPRSTAPRTHHLAYELAGPEELTWRRFATLAAGRRVPLVPPFVLRPVLRAYEALTGPAALLTWDEAARVTASMTTPRGTADAIELGVTPQPPA